MLQRFAGVFLALLVCASAAAQEPAPLLAAIFADHAVLQRDRPIEVWGRAQPSEQVTVVLDNDTRKAQADDSGAWAVTLPAMRTGGTHTLTARTANRSQTVRDLVVGDVWLCSGQSNMEFTVRHALNAGVGSGALGGQWHPPRADPAFRRTHATRGFRGPARVEDREAPTPRRIFRRSATTSRASSSAPRASTCRRGLIHASWGGTRIETWLSKDALRQLGADDARLDLLGRYAADQRRRLGRVGARAAEVVERAAGEPGSEPWSTGKATGPWTPTPAKLTTWEDWGVPALAEYDGAMWYRATVKLTAAQARQAAKISLGVIDDVDEVWINGQPFASGFGEVERNYDVPAKLLKAGDNVVVINVFDMWGSGGHARRRRAIRTALRRWFEPCRWVPGNTSCLPKGMAGIPRAPWEPIAGINILYNGMIAPLGKYGLRGVAWYQGEANAGLVDAQRYQRQLQMLFTDWRRQFDNAMPFFVVQLANYDALAEHAGGQRLGAAARRTAPRGQRGRQRGPGRDHRHRQSRRHPSHQQARGRQATGARRAPRGVRRPVIGVGCDTEERETRRRRRRRHAGRFRRQSARDRSEGPRGLRALRRYAGELPFRERAARRGRHGEAGGRRAGKSDARAILLGGCAAVQSLRYDRIAGGAVRGSGAVTRSRARPRLIFWACRAAVSSKLRT
jgi:sialate O-acetylesterase